MAASVPAMGSVRAKAAVLLGISKTEQTHLLHLLDGLNGEHVLLVYFLGQGLDLLLGKLANHFTNHLLLLGVLEIHT